MRMDTARTNTPAGYPVRRSATPAWPLCICSFGHRALRASSIVFLSSLTRSLTLALLAKTPVRTEVQDWTTPPARRAPVEVLGFLDTAFTFYILCLDWLRNSMEYGPLLMHLFVGPACAVSYELLTRLYTILGGKILKKST